MKLILIISLIWSCTIQYPTQAIAQDQKPAQTKSNTLQTTTSLQVFTPPKVPTRLGRVSGRPKGMASR